MAWKLKEGVSMQGLSIAMREALIMCEQAYIKFDSTMTITSTTDGKHSIGSLHYYGYAFDLRSNDLPLVRKSEVLGHIKESFGKYKKRNYTIILEDEGGVNEHFHVQWGDAKLL